MSGTLILQRGPHVILNTRQIECGVCKRKGRGIVIHETLTHNCRPVVFTNPQNMEAYVKKVTREETAVETLIRAEVIGTPQAISEVEAMRLDPEYRSRPFNQ